MQTTSAVGRGFVFPNQGGCGDGRSVAGPRGILFPLLPGYQAHWGVLPHPQPAWTQLIYSNCQVPHGDPHLYSTGSSQRLVDDVAGSQGHLFACADTPVIGGIFGLLSGTRQGCSIVYQWKVLPFGLATAPRVFAKLLAPQAAHLHLQGCPMYPYRPCRTFCSDLA